MFRRIFRYLRKSYHPYEPLIEVHISKSALLHNLAELRKIAPQRGVAPMLKSNAYGHGLVAVAEILDTQSVPFLVVDSYYEALMLRNEDITSPILIMGYTHTKNILANHLKNIAFTITSIIELEDLATKITRPTTFHLKIDTGMHRQGILYREITEAIALIQSNPYIRLEGICSHFADASNDDPHFTEKQIHLWNATVITVKKSFPKLTYWHISATSGNYYNSKIDANVSRSGLGLYGFALHTKLGQSLAFKPVLSLHAVLGNIKHVKKGENIGYELLFTAPKDMLIGTIPAGYYEGVDKRLTNKGVVYIKDVPCPIVGRVSMNITTIDIGAVPNPKLNDLVTVIGTDRNAPNSAEHIAKLCETSPYEIFIHIPEQLRRVVVA
ncbi:MAG: hypothetical protein RLZZ347_72 [Candidatus Parcubacteria bacterium]|jgi:alanine racemase